MNLIKKALIIIAMLLLISINTFAYDFEVDGIYYNIISLPELTCEVTYKDTNYNSYNGEISIPEIVTYQNREIKVVSIGAHAFYDCDKVESISIPNSVTEIGERAFGGCSGLTKITIPNSVTEIDNYAFNNCTNLAELIIEDGKDKLSLGYNYYYNSSSDTTGNGLFYDFQLEKLYLGRNLSYDYSPFYGNSKLQEVTIGNHVTYIGSSAFSYCDGLTLVTIPNSVTKIGSSAFYQCTGLTEVTIPNSVTWIGSSAFSYCDGLTSITIPNSVTEICDYAFNDCSGLTSVTIPNSVTKIGDYAFNDCSGLTSVTIPNSVTKIGNYAFENCTNLAELIIEDGKDKLSLGVYVFYYCPLKKLYLGRNIYTPNGYSPFYNQYEKRTLESMVISNSVTRINYHLYFDNIKHLTFLDGKTEISLGDLNSNIYLSVDSLYLGRNLSEEYSSISVGNLSQLTIGENVDNLTCFNFKDCNQLCTIESKNMIPPTIGEFSNASYLNTSVIIPHGSINSYLTADVWKFFWNISEAGIESTICDDDISLTIKNGNIIIDNIYSPHVEVYNINGQIVYKGNSTIIPVSTNGLYIVKINNKSYKVIL